MNWKRVSWYKKKKNLKQVVTIKADIFGDCEGEREGLENASQSFCLILSDSLF